MKTLTVDLNSVTVQQMEKLIRLKEKISETEKQIQWVLSGGEKPSKPTNGNGHKRVGRPEGSKMTEEAKAKIAAAQKARWEKYHATKAVGVEQSETASVTVETPSAEKAVELPPPTAEQVNKAFGKVKANKKEAGLVKA